MLDDLLVNAVRYGPDPERIRTLMDAGADVNARREDGWTPLQIATRAGLTELVRLLVQRGAEVDKQNSEGSTPLHIAARFSYPETTEVLIEGGAKVNH